jgi:lipopolysaccharide transport system ATP-binding protein
VTLQVPKGEFVGLLGRNGAGKSTLLRTVGGSYSATSGRVTVKGSLAAIYELGITGNERLTGHEFARRWLALHETSRRRTEAALAEILEFAELGAYFDQPIYTYSAGMRARLFFAVSTSLAGDIYLIDEVLTVGDEHFQAKCWRRMRERLTAGASGILATHDWSAILKLCRTTCVLERGRIVDRGPTPAVVQRYLELPPPRTGPAAFRDLPAVYRAQSQVDAVLRFPIEVATSAPIWFGCSVEAFRQGLGWDHLLHVDPEPVTSRPGRHDIDVTIPTLPLSPGEYSLNLFLSERCPDGTLSSVDVRSWTYGSDLTLSVAGAPRASITVLPVRWREGVAP